MLIINVLLLYKEQYMYITYTEQYRVYDWRNKFFFHIKRRNKLKM